MFFRGFGGLLYHEIPVYQRIKGYTEEDQKQDIEPILSNPEKFWSGVKDIGNYTFMGFGDYIERLTIPDGVFRIGWYAFSGLGKLKDIILPESVSCVGEGAFDGCKSLTSIILPKDLNIIAKDMFKNCIGLKEINLDNVNIIEDGAFDACKSLKKVRLPNIKNIEKMLLEIVLIWKKFKFLMELT